MIKLVLSFFLYFIGNLISKLLYFNCFSFLYAIYNKIMLLSCELDTKGKIWKYN